MFSSNTPTIEPIEFKKSKVSPYAEIWQFPETGEKSLHSLVEFKPRDTIDKFGSKDCLKQPNYLTVQINDTEHILLDPEFLQYINHSCDPNVFFDTTKMVVACLKKIDVGEAMTFFYPSTEWSMDREFDCLCRSEKCLGKIQGATHLSLNIIENYSLNKYIKERAYKVIQNQQIV